MRRFWGGLGLGAMALLSACADPLADIERLSEVAVAPAAGEAAVAPAASETGNAPGFLGRLLAGVGRPAAAAAPQAPLSDPASDQAAGAQPGAQPDIPAVSPGTLLPYGQVAQACGLDPGALGTVIGQAAGFTLHDTAPASTALRTHYITGFADRCARQFSAALALFGDLPTHEMIRYLPGGPSDAYSATDRAYEEIKGQVCGVPAGQPCGARLDLLSREAAFVTVYQTFGTNPDWSEILLHDGQVAAVSFEGD